MPRLRVVLVLRPLFTAAAHGTALHMAATSPQPVLCGHRTVLLRVRGSGDGTENSGKPPWHACGGLYQHPVLTAWDLTGKRVLDLGCGHGLAGLLAGLRGAKAVHFTDRSADSVAAALQAAVDNHLACTFTGAAADWAEALPMHAAGDWPAADLIIGNDLLYFTEAPDLLSSILLSNDLLPPGGICVIAGNDRGHWAAFEERLQSSGLFAHVESVRSKIATSRRGCGLLEKPRPTTSTGAEEREEEDEEEEEDDAGASLEPSVILVAHKAS